MSDIKQNSVYLENEHSIPLYPAVALAFGVQGAIIIQQIRYWMKNYRLAENKLPSEDRLHYERGRWWVYNTYEQWQRDNFGFWSQRTIQRQINKLESIGVLLSAEFNQSSGDRTKWYTIDFDKMDILVEQAQAKIKPSSQNVDMVTSECPDGLVKVARSYNIETETTTETTKDSVTPGGAQSDPQPPKHTKQERDQLFDAFVLYGLKLQPRTKEANAQGWRVGPIISWLLGSEITVKANGGTHIIPGYSLPVTVEDVQRFFTSWPTNINKPTTPAGFTSHFPTWHAEQRAAEADAVEPLTEDELEQARKDMFAPIPGLTAGAQW
jgi:hypothetical protein